MKRHISIIIFVTLFISAVSAIAIIIAKGYTIKEDEVYESGILDIESTPSGGTVFVDGLAKESTPKKIELITGTYEISIIKDGYKTWKKEITVEPAVVTEVLATLIPTNLEVEQATFVEVEKAFFSEDGNIALYTVTKSSNRGIWLIPLEKSIFNLSATKPSRIGKLDLIPEECQDSRNYIFQISSDNKKALLECEQKNSKLLKLFNLENLEEKVLNVNETIGFNPTSTRFGYASSNLIIEDNDILSSFDINTKKLTLLSKNSDLFTSQLTYNGSTAFLLKNSYNNSKKTLHRLDENLQASEVKTNIDLNSIISIISPNSSEKSVLALTGKTGSYLVFNNNFTDPISFSENQITFLKWSRDGYHFLFIEKDSLKSGHIREMPDKSIRIDTFLIAKNYTNLKWSIDWSQESNQIVVEDQKKDNIYIYDFDGQNKTLIFSGELAYPEAFKLSVNETFLVILLKDSKNSSNLYTVKLKI
ncbi:MAG: PEGA domain-containing protein [Candidatus Dojkabacteria bacterium]|nr:PEGA domain-containing protein [Candidatus Dojkabacteria bacterium]